MLIRFTVTRKDTNAPVPNARIEVEKAETVGFTDAKGKAELITYWSGNWLYSVTAAGYEVVRGTLNNRDIPVLDFAVSLLYNAKSTPPTPGPKEEVIQRIGTSCSIINNFTFAKSAYQVRHDRKGNLSSLIMDLEETRSIANRKPECFETPPPPPKTTDELSEEVSTLQKLLNNTVGKIENLGQAIEDIVSAAQDEAQAWRKAVDGIWDKMEDWLIERIVGILLKGLDHEVEVMEKNGRA